MTPICVYMYVQLSHFHINICIFYQSKYFHQICIKVLLLGKHFSKNFALFLQNKVAAIAYIHTGNQGLQIFWHVSNLTFDPWFKVK